MKYKIILMGLLCFSTISTFSITPKEVTQILEQLFNLQTTLQTTSIKCKITNEPIIFLQETNTLIEQNITPSLLFLQKMTETLSQNPEILKILKTIEGLALNLQGFIIAIQADILNRQLPILQIAITNPVLLQTILEQETYKQTEINKNLQVTILTELPGGDDVNIINLVHLNFLRIRKCIRIINQLANVFLPQLITKLQNLKINQKFSTPNGPFDDQFRRFGRPGSGGHSSSSSSSSSGRPC